MRAITGKSFLSLGLALLFPFIANAQVHWWEVQTSGANTNFRGVSVVRERLPFVHVIWVSGSNGMILHSLDRGRAWRRVHVAGGDTLDFRGIVAFGEKTAYVMSSGESDKSRIYKTVDGGETWTLQYSGDRKEVFLDSLACINEKECVALGDPIDGKFLLLKTADGEHWSPLPTDKMPLALPGEGAFAASNSCLLLSDNALFFGTGGPAARVFRSLDSGQSWTVSETPIAHGNASSGIFSLSADNGDRVLVVGGDYKEVGNSDRTAAVSADRGKTWQLAAKQPGGFRSGVAQIDEALWVSVGPTGEDLTKDFGAHWNHADSLNLNAVVILDKRTGWAVGPKGTIARLINHFGYEFHHGGSRRETR